jgi:hypothetical protein
MMNDLTRGKVAFQAYSKAVGRKTHDGKPIPEWEDLSETVRNGWEAAANAVVKDWKGHRIAVEMRQSSG